MRGCLTELRKTAVLADLWVDPPAISGGMITAPERPGHGLAFKPDMIRQHRI